jgi:hypothetical protein
MSEKKIKKITDRKLFTSIFSKIFLNHDVFLKKDNEVIAVKFMNYEGGVSTLKIPPGHLPFGQVIVYVDRKTDVVYSHLNFIAQTENDLYTFDTIDIQKMEFLKMENGKIVSESRSENRIGQLYISNIVSDFSMTASLSTNSRRVEYLRQMVINKLSPRYSHVAGVFLGDKKPNPRMDFFQKERRPYFIPEFRQDLIPDKKDQQFFMSTIYGKDSILTKNHLKSEICVPLLYKFMLPFGYIQVNSTEALTEHDYSDIRKLGMSTSMIFTNNSTIIRCADDIMLVGDLSAKGLSIVFRDKPLIKHFKDKSTILFDIFLPENMKATTLACVRNISLTDNNIYRVGCEILNMDSIGEVYYGSHIEAVRGNASVNGNCPPVQTKNQAN